MIRNSDGGTPCCVTERAAKGTHVPLNRFMQRALLDREKPEMRLRLKERDGLETQADLAREADVYPSGLTAIKKGTTGIGWKNAFGFAKAYRIPLGELIIRADRWYEETGGDGPLHEGALAPSGGELPPALREALATGKCSAVANVAAIKLWDMDRPNVEVDDWKSFISTVMVAERILAERKIAPVVDEVVEGGGRVKKQLHDQKEMRRKVSQKQAEQFELDADREEQATPSKDTQHDPARPK